MKCHIPIEIKDDLIKEVLYNRNIKVMQNTYLIQGTRMIWFEFNNFKYNIVGSLKNNKWKYFLSQESENNKIWLNETQILELFALLKIETQISNI